MFHVTVSVQRRLVTVGTLSTSVKKREEPLVAFDLDQMNESLVSHHDRTHLPH